MSFFSKSLQFLTAVQLVRKYWHFVRQVMNNYAELTGDWDGVTGTAPNVIGKCFDTYFWYAPGCRAQPSRCLTWFTGGAGWGMWEVLAKAAIYNMPLATAVASSFGEWGTLPLSDNMNFLMYWWVPDPTFLRLGGRIESSSTA